MAGLIQNTMNTTSSQDALPNNQVAVAGSVGYDPAQRTVNPATDTVAGQLDTVLGSGSPVLQRAQSQALDTANSRGLLNSTMAAQAGTAAMIDAATPIAAADANTYATAGAQNTAAQNTALETGATAANQSSLQNVTNENAMALQGLRGTQAGTLADIEANYKTLMQSSASAATVFKGAQDNIAAIQADPNTSTEQKQSAVNSITQLLQASLNTIGAIGNINLGGLLDFSISAA